MAEQHTEKKQGIKTEENQKNDQWNFGMVIRVYDLEQYAGMS